MRVRWLPIALGVSLLANVWLMGTVLVMALDAGHYEADQRSSWESMARERQELHAMRAHFCSANAAPDRASVLAWSASRRSADSRIDPFDKDGLLWLPAVGVKFDVEDRVVGVCLSHAWGLVDDPSGAEQDAAGEFCPLEPLC